VKVSVLIVTHNSVPLLIKCLDSVLAQKTNDVEIIVVDNGSLDGTQVLMRESYSGITFISNSSNQGASFARNQGIALSRADWILTLDVDAVLSQDFFKNFEKFLNEECSGTVGIVIPKILYPDGKTIYSLGHRLTFLRRFIDVGHDKADGLRWKKNNGIFGACAATAFYNHRMLKEISMPRGDYFDKDLFFIAEDVDLAWRARKKGWKAVTCYACVSYHEGNSMRLDESKKRFYEIRNRLLIMFKNDLFLYRFLFFVPLFLYEAARVVMFTIRGQGGVYKEAFLAAWKMRRCLT
jgi:GT2 family glycosyltransferase